MIKKRIAIIGAGISGLGCAYALRQHPEFDITIYEAGNHIGGHSNTVDFSCELNGRKSRTGVTPDFWFSIAKPIPA